MNFMAGFQIVNLLILVLALALGIAVIVIFIKVLLKLNKALDIWLEQNEKK